MKHELKRKGIFFTLAMVFLVIPLLLLVSFYVNQSKSEITDESEKIRCEELHYWIEDVRRDLQRAVVIFGRRAAIYTISEVVDKGGIKNYTFQCNPMCGVDCENFRYTENGSEAAITELVLCGTLYSQNVSYMINHTLREWVDRILQHGEQMHFTTNITLKEIKVVPSDAWNFAIIIENEISSKDERKLCSYRETPTSVMSITSIVGLEDPLYPLNTNALVIKYMYNCTIELELNNVFGNGTSGNGNGTGTVVLYSNLGGSSVEDRVCNVPNKETKIIVFDQAVGLINNPNIENCLNEFAGAIDYRDVGGDPNITSPYVYGTDDLNLSDYDCIWIRNTETEHETLRGVPLDELNTSCYDVSFLEGFGENCSAKYLNGPSFFDRLDGNYFVSEKYVNQSSENFNATNIGIETIIDLYELLYHGISVNENASFVDYLYWQDVYGTEINGICTSYGYKFRLDCQHMDKYGLVATTTTTTTTTTPAGSTTTTTTTVPVISTTTLVATTTTISTTTAVTTSTIATTTTTTQTTSTTTTSTTTTTTTTLQPTTPTTTTTTTTSTTSTTSTPTTTEEVTTTTAGW